VKEMNTFIQQGHILLIVKTFIMLQKIFFYSLYSSKNPEKMFQQKN